MISNGKIPKHLQKVVFVNVNVHDKLWPQAVAYGVRLHLHKYGRINVSPYFVR